MELVTFVLFMAIKVLYIAIITLLLAIPSGIGLGFGLYAVKKFTTWWNRRKTKTPEERAKDYGDILDETEAAAASTQGAN